jgi:hypothetical protein
MSGTTTASWWQYSRWVYIIGRSLLKNPPTGAEKTAVETFIQAIVNPSTGSRKGWLSNRARTKCERLQAGTEPLVTSQPNQAEAKIVMLIGRDLKKIPLTAAEEVFVGTLITATGNRRYGVKGGTI